MVVVTVVLALAVEVTVLALAVEVLALAAQHVPERADQLGTPYRNTGHRARAVP